MFYIFVTMPKYIAPSLFPDFDASPQPQRPKTHTGGSGNPIVFHDYESYIAKFRDVEKTTDDTYTPRDVYEAVCQYVDETVGLAGHKILRPFYPGGDYQNAEYPEDGIVIDNPPFSIFTSICKWYAARRIPFFIFGPGLTIGSIFSVCTAVIVGHTFTFENGAKVKCNFASNLFGDTVMMTAPRLDALLKACPSQDNKVNQPKYAYPKNILSVSDMQTIARRGISFAVHRSEAIATINLDNYPKKGGLFGTHLLISTAKAQAKAQAKAKAQNVIPFTLSPREQAIIRRLDAHDTSSTVW